MFTLVRMTVHVSENTHHKVSTNLIIRREQVKEYQENYSLNKTASGQVSEAELVDKLRKNKVNTISLVAEFDQKIAGHILLSEMHTADNTSIKIMGLAPMAVHPDFQQQGIGSQLICILFYRVLGSIMVGCKNRSSFC